MMGCNGMGLIVTDLNHERPFFLDTLIMHALIASIGGSPPGSLHT